MAHADESPPVTPAAEGEPSERESVLGALANLGPVAQAAIPGIYAWSITVAPLAWTRGAPLFVKAFAATGLAAAALAPLAEARAPSTARAVSIWGLTLSSALVWIVVPAAVSSRIDGARAVAGMLGWALFAFASAAPAPPRDPSAGSRVVAAASLRPRTRVAAGDRAFIGVGMVVAAAYQAIGWVPAAVERVLLIRLAAIAAGLAILGGATTLALARHDTANGATAARRVRAAAPWLAALVTVLAAGLVARLAR